MEIHYNQGSKKRITFVVIPPYRHADALQPTLSCHHLKLRGKAIELRLTCVAAVFRSNPSGAELEVQDKQPLLEWLANNYKKFGCQLEFVTNKWVHFQ
jgi:hypothetical protein